MLRRTVTVTTAALALTMTVLPVAPMAAAATVEPAATSYLRPVNYVPLPKGCAVLKNGINGVKVKLVQRKLGFPAGYWENYDARTVRAVRAFQSRRGLAVTGVVGPRTWKALGISKSWCMDRYRARIEVADDATQAQRTRQLLTFVKRYLGEEYVWGGAGRVGEGVDCSGLILQGLYSAGLNVSPITLDKHVLRDYRTSKEMYAHPDLKHVALRSARPGDLVFWRSNSTGRVNHVAVYIGSGKVLEAASSAGKVRIGTVANRSTQTLKPTVVRPFPTL